MTLGAQRSATGRMQTGPQECGEEMVTGNERHRHCVERELSRTGHDASLERRAARPVRPVARCLPAWLCDDATAAFRTPGRSSTGPMTKDNAMARHEYSAPLTGDARIVERPDGTRLRTFCAGTGPKTVLLAHGYGFGAWEWNLVEPQLVERGFRVITFDQRGHQGSSIGSDGINSAAMASDYGAILEAYDVHDGILVGHSMGGFLSVAFLTETPGDAAKRLRGLILMATFAGGVSEKNPQNRLQIPMIRLGVLQRLLRFGPVATGFTKSLTGDAFEPAMTPALTKLFLGSDHQQLIPILRAMVDEKRYDLLGSIDLPTTVIIGTKDATTPPFHSRQLHEGITGSTFVSVEGMGHCLNWESPNTIVAEIEPLAD